MHAHAHARTHAPRLALFVLTASIRLGRPSGRAEGDRGRAIEEGGSPDSLVCSGCSEPGWPSGVPAAPAPPRPCRPGTLLQPSPGTLLQPSPASSAVIGTPSPITARLPRAPPMPTSATASPALPPIPGPELAKEAAPAAAAAVRSGAWLAPAPPAPKFVWDAPAAAAAAATAATATASGDAWLAVLEAAPNPCPKCTCEAAGVADGKDDAEPPVLSLPIRAVSSL